ncbi:MAG: hypothetical protein FWG25_11555, partial [Promicromonosporaceae bacterium]|nr:hypothetical protein [Promicromonosporaceae bacterium]
MSTPTPLAHVTADIVTGRDSPFLARNTAAVVNVDDAGSLPENQAPNIELPVMRADAAQAKCGRRWVLGVTLAALFAMVAVFGGPWVPILLSGGRIWGGALPQLNWSGATAISQPLLLVFTGLAFLTRSGFAVQYALLFGAIPLAGLAAWGCAGQFTRSLPVRCASALAWGLAPSLLGALAGGYLGAIVTHFTLPWLVLALTRANGVEETPAPSKSAAHRR